MDSDFGISKTLKNLSSSKVQEVVKYLKDDLGVEDIKDLKKVYENDLTKDKLLKPIQARNLIEYWGQELATNPINAPAAGGIQQNIEENAGRVVAVGRNYKEINNRAETMNTFENVEKVQTGGTSSSKQRTKAMKKQSKKKSSSSDSDTTSSDDSSSSENDPCDVNVKIDGKARIGGKSVVIGKGNATTTKNNHVGSQINIQDSTFDRSSVNQNEGDVEITYQ